MPKRGLPVACIKCSAELVWEPYFGAFTHRVLSDCRYANSARAYTPRKAL